MTEQEARKRDVLIEKKLEEQVALLSERSKKCEDAELPALTRAMIEAAKYLKYGVF